MSTGNSGWTPLHEEIYSALQLFVSHEGQVTEIRSFRDDKPICNTLSKDLKWITRRAVELERDGKPPSGVYFMPNPINPEKIPAGKTVQGGSAKEEDIVRRFWLLIDADPVRVDEDGTPLERQVCPTTDSERAIGWEVIDRVESLLDSMGFVCPILGDSGNGFHLCYPIDLPVTIQSYEQISKFLRGLDTRCGEPSCRIDQKTKDAPRIWKLYGTISRKGLESPGRVYRQSGVIRGVQPTQVDREQNNASLARLISIWDQQEAAQAQLRPATVASLPPTIIERAIAYLEKEEPAVSGSKGHDRLFHVAGILIQGFNLDETTALHAIQAWNTRCVPPWNDKDILRKFREVEKSPCDKPRGYLRDAELPVKDKIRSTVSAYEPTKAASKLMESGTLLVTPASEIQPRAVEWLWPGRIPVGKLTTFAGVGGLGKTFTLCDISARVTRGSEWPDSEPGSPPGSVLFVSGEDDPEDTLVPRLIELGADLSKIFFLSSEAQGCFTLRDIPLLEKAMEQCGGNVKLIVIDPPTAYLGGVDDHKNSELRQLLSPLQLLARNCNVALIFNTHVNKGGNQKVEAMMRVMGSVAWVNAVRAAYMFARDPEDPDKRLFVGMKMNIAKEKKGLSYRIISTTGNLARVEWLGAVETTADQALNREPKKKGRGDKAAKWLIEKFQERREWKSDELFREGTQAGYPRSAIFEAKEVLNLPKAKKVTYENGDSCWVWWVPENWEHFPTESDTAEF